jgi:hypothetical protein
VKPVSETPTERADYALISVAYAGLLAATAASARGKPMIDQREILPLSAATFALAKLVVHEKAETWVRAPFVEETAEGKRPRGRRLRYAVGELLSCTRCIGAWSALGLIGLRLHNPHAGRFVTSVLAVSAVNDFLQSGFSLLCETTNKVGDPQSYPTPSRDASAGRFAATASMIRPT